MFEHATGIQATADSPAQEEPNQEPTWTDIRRRPATPGDCQAWSSAQSATLSHAQRRSERDWGSRGRRFKSGRPDWQSAFFEYTSTTQEPTKEPTCCATAPPQARTARATAPHQDMCQDTRTGQLTSQGAQEH